MDLLLMLLAWGGTLVNPQGQSIGRVDLQLLPHGALLLLEGHLPKGIHVLHIHENGVCEGNFKSAGGHYNPQGKAHGLNNPNGYHRGDLPNIHVVADTFAVEVFIPGFTSKDLQEPRAVVIHEGPDDYQSQPAGNAGKRIACAVLKP